MSLFKKINIHILLIVVAMIMIFQLIWMILLSLKQFPDCNTSLNELLSSTFTISNYADALKSDDFGKYFLNSIFVSLMVTLGNLLFCLMVGYALARKNFSGKDIFFMLILGVIIIPPHVIMIPLYRLMVSLDWINSYYALIMPWLVSPFGIFLVKQYVETLPKEIEDAARIDGAGEWYIIFRIVAPLSKPILTVLAVYIFLGNWNSFLFPYLFTNSAEYRTLPVGLTFYLGKQSVDWGHLMAGAGISALPVLILFMAFQKQIIQGLTAGALKD